MVRRIGGQNRVSFWGDENIKLTMVMVAHTYKYTKSHQILPSKLENYFKNLVGPEMATIRSTASEKEPYRQGKDDTAWYGNEGKEGRKWRVLQKQRSNKIHRILPFSHHYYQYHYPLKKLQVLLNCVHKMPKNRKKKNSSQSYCKNKTTCKQNISAV